jgi:ammonium transporter Rh
LQEKTVINTTFAIGASCFWAALVSKFIGGHINIEVILNATLAGGVAIGASADLFKAVYIALLVGSFAGILSCCGFMKIGPYLSEKIGLHDTCGVHSLHGMPGVLGGLVSAIILSPNLDLTEERNYKLANGQAQTQIFGLLTTLAFAIGAGFTGGFLASRKCWNGPTVMFLDTMHFGSEADFPQEYLVDDKDE